jgi:hypothetical protein
MVRSGKAELSKGSNEIIAYAKRSEKEDDRFVCCWVPGGIVASTAMVRNSPTKLALRPECQRALSFFIIPE